METSQILIIAYFAIIFVIGFDFDKKRSSGLSFLYAGRKLTIPAFVATLVSTWYGGILELGRHSHLHGISTWLVFGLPYYIAAFIYARYILKRISFKNNDSIPSRFYSNYGKYPALLAVLLIFLLASPAPYLKMLAEMLEHVFQIDIGIALLIGATFSIAYTLKGGFESVIKTDIIQFILMFLGFGYMAIYLYLEYGGYDYLNSNLIDSKNKLSLPGSLEWSYIFTWGFIALITFVDPSFYQRIYSSKSKSIAKKGMYLSIGFWLLFDFLAITVGLYAAAILPEAKQPYLELVDSLALNPLITGVFIVSMASIIMSTIDSFTFASGFTIGKDFMSILKNDSNSTYHVRTGIIISGLFSIILAHFFTYAIDIWFTIGSFAVPGLLIPLLFIYFNISLKNPFISMATPVAVACLWFLYGIKNGLYPFSIEPMYPGIITSMVLCYLNKKPIS